MKKILLPFLFQLLVLPLLFAEELVVDFKPNFAKLPERMQSKDVTATPGPALLLSSANMASKLDPKATLGSYVGKDFYVFGKNARKWQGKNLLATFQVRHLAGPKTFSAGYRVFGNGNQLMTGRHIDIDAPIDGEWHSYQLDIAIPDAAGIENFNIVFGFYQDGEAENAFVIDDLKVYHGMESGLHLSPARSLGMPTLLDKEPLQLVRDGKPTFVIVLEEEPSLVAAYAAEELQYHLKLMTGVAPAVQKGGKAPQGPAIWIGNTAMTREYGMAPDMLPKDSWIVARVGKDILIAGGDATNLKGYSILSRGTYPLGTLFGTYEFLERVFQVRWFWPGETGIVAPKAKDVSVTRLYESGSPAYSCRAMFYDIPKELSLKETVKWHRRLRVGGADPDPIGMHSFKDWPQKYGDQPELFALQPSGKRKNNDVAGTHLCLTNPKVIDLAAKCVIDYFDKHPDAKFCDVMPGDSNDLYFCRCPNCQKTCTPEKGSAGVHTNATWGFVNAVAAKVATAKPGRYIKCCAYSDYRMVPDFPLMPNVAVTLCYGAHPRGHIGYKKAWRQFIDQWSATGASLYVWEYWNSTRYSKGVYGAPAIYPRQLKELYALDRNQIKGRVIELADINSYGVGVRSWADWLYDLPNLYIGLKLAWNPALDVEDELQRYYRDFFGPAETQAREFYDTLEIAWTKSCWMLNGKGIWDYDTCWNKTYPPELVDRLMALLKDAVRITAGQEPYATRAKMLLEAYEPFQRNSNIFRGAKASTRPSTLVLPVTKAPVLDGVIGDDWKDAVKVDGFVDSYNVYEIESKTTLYLKRDGAFLYVAGQADTPKTHLDLKFPPKDAPARDFFLWDWESIELLFAGNDGEIRQFIVAPDNLLFDAHWSANAGDKPDYKKATAWNPDVLLKTARGEDGSWRFEMAIPLAALDFAKRPAANAVKADFARNHYYKKAPQQASHNNEQSLWLPTFSGFHNVERYGTVEFKR